MRLVMISLFFLTLSQPLYAAGLAEQVRQEQLDNGLTLLMLEQHDAPTVTALITFRVGGANEESATRGVAHLLEHMLFKGTRTLGTRNYPAEKKLLEQIEKVGNRIDLLKNDPDADAEKLKQLRERLVTLQEKHKQYVVKDEFSRIYAEHGGVGYNAFTSKDQTTYLISLPANKLELWAAIESDRLQNAVLREFYTEREVVREERRRSYETDPGGLLYETLISNAYTLHPYRNPVIGWDSDIANLSLAEARDFFTRYYRAANMIVTLVGDFDSDATLELVKRYFGTLPSGIKVPPVRDREPPQRGEKRVTVYFDAEPRMLMAYHKPSMPNVDDYCADLLMDILTSGATSRLYKRLVLEEQVATSVSSFGGPGSRYDNLLVFSAIPRYPHTTEDVEALIYAELERLKTEPVSEVELNRARNRLVTDNLRSMRSNSGLASMLSSYEAISSWRYLTTYADKLAEIDSAMLIAFANRYLTDDNRTLAILKREAE